VDTEELSRLVFFYNFIFISDNRFSASLVMFLLKVAMEMTATKSQWDAIEGTLQWWARIFVDFLLAFLGRFFLVSVLHCDVIYKSSSINYNHFALVKFFYFYHSFSFVGSK